MLYESLLLLKGQLNAYYTTLHERVSSIDPSPVILENVAALNETQLGDAQNVYITLVNLAEESTLRNTPNFRKQDDRTVYEQPPIYLNLHVLFSVVMRDEYEKALLHLSHLIKFFQGQPVFNQKLTADHSFGTGAEFNLIMDLCSPSLEQANFLWSTLGGRQYPSALYKLRLLEMKRDSMTATRDLISEITLKD